MNVKAKDALILVNIVINEHGHLAWTKASIPDLEAGAWYLHEVEAERLNLYKSTPRYMSPQVHGDQPGPCQFHRDTHRDFLTFSSRRVKR